MMHPNLNVSTFMGIISPRSPFEFLGFFAITMAINISSNLFLGTAGIISSVTLIFAVFTTWYYLDRKRALKIAFPIQGQQPKPAKGLILLLGPYDPRIQLVPSELLAGIEKIKQKPVENLVEEDFQCIHFLTSNLQPQITAVEFHQKANTLRDLWIITTKSIPATPQKAQKYGSEDAGILLEKYLRFKYGTTSLVIHRNQDLSIDMWDYSALWKKTETIFRTSGYKDEVILADVTGGTKLMSVALAMACIPPKRCMQYMDAERDWQGQPVKKGEMAPILIDVDPIFYNESK